eukprot:gnl/Spiro4/14301_TR7692_c0_g1_i1.p1 gnl/Spiro4/14301_TR7692_c0_g1~~gnl/Spiro4/14301_TR7692_c0_g1_i1.p1  ORF type:complete len:135 (-),score=39.85 gnl/Spiro4/14301_TR7692_c0_g1_i1:213-617(-)
MSYGFIPAAPLWSQQMHRVRVIRMYHRILRAVPSILSNYRIDDWTEESARQVVRNLFKITSREKDASFLLQRAEQAEREINEIIDMWKTKAEIMPYLSHKNLHLTDMGSPAALQDNDDNNDSDDEAFYNSIQKA